MSDTFYPAGYVLTGKYEGKNIYKETRDSFMIVSGDNDNKIVTDSIFKTYYQNLKTISRSTVKCYEDVSSVHHGPNMSSVAKGAFWFGAAGALVSAAVSQSNTYDIALEFNDGDKFLIRITVAGYYQEFKRIFFDFPTITQNSTPAIPSNTDQNLQGTPVSQAAPLLERAYIFLEDGDFAKADEYFEKVLDLEPKNANAYVGKLLVDLKITNQSQLSELETPSILNDNPWFIKALKYGNKELVSQLNKYTKSIEQRIKREYESTPQGMYEIAVKLFENAVTSDDFLRAATAFEKIPDYMDTHSYIEKCYGSSIDAKYREAATLMAKAKSETEYKQAAKLFESIVTHLDSGELVVKCNEKAAECCKNDIYRNAKSEAAKANIASLLKAIELYKSISGWKDADDQILKHKAKVRELREKEEKERIECEQKAEQERIEAANRAKRNKTIAIITTTIVCAIIAFIIVLSTVIIPNNKYNDAIALMNDGKYTEAIVALESLNGYKDSLQKIEEIHSSGKLQARKLAEEGKYQEAADLSNKYGLNEDAEHYSKISNGEYWRLCEHFDFKEIVLPDNITSIGERAFLNCSNLTKITIPNNVTSIGKSAFSGCSSLTSITIPNNVTSIGESAFSGCSSLTSITIPNNVTRISKSTFADCSSLTNIEIPNSVEIIDEAAFSGCSSLTKMTIPENVTQISKDVLNGCNNLQELTIPFTGLSVDSIEYEAHVGYIFGYDYDSGRYSPTGHFYTTSGSSYSTKYNCYTYNIPKSLKTVVVTNSTTIKAYAFQNCNNLERIEICEGVTTIADYAFRGCDNLKTLIIPNSICSVSSSQFAGLSNINYNEFDNAYYLGNIDNPFLILIKAKNTGITSCNISEQTKIIYTTAFADCINLTSIQMPKGIVTIAYHAFSGCTSLTNVLIPNSVTSIGVSAFENCSSLTKIVIPDSVISLGSYSFENCTSLNSVIIGNGITDIPERVFYNCPLITNVVLSKNIATIDFLAFFDPSVSTLYFAGAKSEWDDSLKEPFKYYDRLYHSHYPTIYYYSETRPTTTGNYWHYVDGVPTIW